MSAFGPTASLPTAATPTGTSQGDTVAMLGHQPLGGASLGGTCDEGKRPKEEKGEPDTAKKQPEQPTKAEARRGDGNGRPASLPTATTPAKSPADTKDTLGATSEMIEVGARVLEDLFETTSAVAKLAARQVFTEMDSIARATARGDG